MGFIVKLVLFPLRFLRWLISLIVIAAALVILFPKPAEGLSEAQRNAVSQNCTNIKQSLAQLQKVDSRTRTYLGTTYETILTRFIVPLNLRLVKNNRPSLPTVQSDFTSEQVKFRDSYTDYMRELESLTSIDCRVQPDDFYARLEVVREKRSILRDTTVRLARLADEQYRIVQDLRDSL